MRLSAPRNVALLCAAALGATAVTSIPLTIANASIPPEPEAELVGPWGTEPDFIQTGLRTIYLAEHIERVDAYLEVVGRVDAYFESITRVDAFLKAVVWNEAAARAEADIQAQAEAAESARAASVPAAAPQPKAPPAARPAPPPAPASNAALAAQLFDMVNGERARAGLPALGNNGSLQRAAVGYAGAMASTRVFSHTGTDGSTFGSRIVAAGYPGNRWMGEIIAMGTGIDATTIMRMWMNSPGHHAQIMGANYTSMGAGCASNGAETYCVIDFGG